MRSLTTLAAAFVAALAFPGAMFAEEAGHGPEIKAQEWSFAPPFGHYDQAQLQRGFQVFQQVCTACHGLARPPSAFSA